MLLEQIQPSDHAIYSQKKRKTHVIIQSVHNGMVYAKNYQCEKLYCAKPEMFEPFTLEEAEKLLNQKTKHLVRLIRQGRAIRTAGARYVLKDDKLVLDNQEPNQFDPNTQMGQFKVQPFFYKTNLPKTYYVSRLETEFNHSSAGCFAAYGTIGNNRTQVAMQQKQGEKLLHVRKEIGHYRLELTTLTDVVADGLDYIFRILLLKPNECPLFDQVIDDFIEYSLDAFTPEDQAALQFIKNDVHAQFSNESVLKLTHFCLYCEQRYATELQLSYRCMAIVFADWIVQNIGRYCTFEV